MKKYLVITGGAGFVGSNLIKHFLKKTNYNIISIDNYSSGSKKNHITSPRVVYKNSDTKNISKIIKNPKEIDALFQRVWEIVAGTKIYLHMHLRRQRI